jgi:hypothetical protein
MIKNGNEYCCDICGELIAKCDTDIDYNGVPLYCEKCLKYVEKYIDILKAHAKKDTSKFCDHLRDKNTPCYPQGCKLGNATSPLWCEKKERCHYFKAQETNHEDHT